MSMHFISKLQTIVQNHGSKTALFVDGKPTHSYQELWDNAQKVAFFLVSNNVQTGNLVALNLEKSPEYIIALLGVWISENAFMPLPPSLPEKRKQFILQDTKPVVTFFDSKHSSPKEDNTVDIRSVLPEKRQSPITGDIKSEDLAYVFYTSGSTGNPKGVLVSHSGLLNVLEQQIEFFKVTSESRVLSYLSITFDAFVSDLGTTLLAGAGFFIETPSNIKIASQLPSIIEDRKISHADLPPSLLEVLDVRLLSKHLKTVVIGGAVCSDQAILQWSQAVHLVNVYGPTEATICTSMIECDPKTWKGPNIGRPLENIDYLILDPSGNPVQGGQTGELYIGGIALAQGYLNQPELTQRAFVFIDDRRYYKTGDLVEQNGANYFFRGRIDRQLKIRGQLVCPEEIETALKNNLSIQQSIITPSVSKDKQQLVAFIEKKKGHSLTTKEVRTFLEQYVPSYMIPQKILFLDTIPRNRNQKVDYPALKQILLTGSRSPQQETSHSVLENKFITVWKQVLNNPDINIHDDFFDIGGDSLAVLEIVMGLKKQDIDLPIGLIAEKRTIQKITHWMEQDEALFDGISTEMLLSDLVLSEDWEQLLKKSKTLSHKTTNTVFMTGATGFLGIHLLEKILKNTDNQIRTLVRAKNKTEALERIQKTAEKYMLDFSKYKDRILPLCGDMSKKNLGLSEQEWNLLSMEASEIYHCAAVVHMVNGYEDLKKSNVYGTQEIARLALTEYKKTIHYCSTLSVFVATDKNTGVMYEDDTLIDTKTVSGGYAQSKWVAERFLQQLSSFLDINIFRLGLITGHSINGQYSEHDSLKMFIEGIRSLGVIPKTDLSTLKIDITPVDFAVDAMSRITQKSSSGTFHISNTKGVSLKEIVLFLATKDILLKEVSVEEWNRIIQSKELTKNELFASMALCRCMEQKTFEQNRSMDLFQATGIIFDQTNTQQSLSPKNCVCPKADDALLETYFNSFFDL